MAAKKSKKSAPVQPEGVKSRIMESHTDEGLDDARTERVVDTSVRVADRDA